MTIAVTTKQHQIKKDQFQEKILQFFTPQNFIVDNKISNINQALAIIYQKFLEEDVVDLLENLELSQQQDEELAWSTHSNLCLVQPSD